MSTNEPDRLVDCRTREAQASWVKGALLAGKVLSDAELWLAGVDRPSEMIAGLVSCGLRIATTEKRVIDAANRAHNDLAWKIEIE